MNDSHPHEETLMLVEEAISEKESYAAIEILNRLKPQAAANVYEKAQLRLYWKKKDVSAMIALSRAGIQHALTTGQRVTDPKEVYAFRSSAKALAYNLASFTWPGWNEKDIILTQSDLAIGLDAARLNLRLAEELNRPKKAMANAQWAVGAHQLAARALQAAEVAFNRGKAYAADSGERVLVKMLQGYEFLTEALKNPNSEQAQSRFEISISKLKDDDSEEGPGYAAQLSTAFMVFSK